MSKFNRLLLVIKQTAFASYTASSMCFEVTKVACAPSSRRRGYAKNAVAAILDEARKKKIARDVRRRGGRLVHRADHLGNIGHSLQTCW